VYVDKDASDTLTSRERVADFISGVMQTEVNSSLSRSDTGAVKFDFVVYDDYDARHFVSQFRIVKNISSGHGFVV